MLEVSTLLCLTLLKLDYVMQWGFSPHPYTVFQMRMVICFHPLHMHILIFLKISASINLVSDKHTASAFLKEIT